MPITLPAYAELGWPFTHAQARVSDHSPATIARRVATGEWLRLHSGVYAVAGTAHPQVPLAAALLAAGPRATLSHRSAARLLGIELWEAPERPALTVPRAANPPHLAGVDVHRSDLAVDERDEVYTLGPPQQAWPLTAVGRTLVDLALSRPPLEAVVAMDSALWAARLDASDLAALLARQQGKPGMRRLRQVIELCDTHAESVLESVLRVLICQGGLPRPVSQHWVYGHGRRVGRVDLAYPAQRIAVEADGRTHEEERRFERDRQRQNALINLGWRVLRFTHHDLRFRPAQVVADVRAALGAG